jgi:hypothetical protein
MEADLVVRVDPGSYGSVQISWAECRQNRRLRSLDLVVELG